MTEMEPSMSLTPSFIYNLPNEVLERIISYVPKRMYIKWRENGKAKRLVQIMVLLQVCRAFRAAVFESRAFLDWNFTFCSLVPIRRGGVTDNPETALRATRLVDVLLADQHFVRTLARKREWLFCEPPEVLYAVLSGLPTFRDSIQKVCVNLDYFTDDVLSRLSICSGITELAVYTSYADIRLDSVARLFPRLQHLKLAVPAEVSGSLSALKCLQSLELAITAIDFQFGVRLVPFDSAETLSSLRIESWPISFKIFKLTPFRNLRHITFKDDCEIDDIVECLCRLDIYLETFEGYFETLQALPCETFFSIPSLSRLQSLSIIVTEFSAVATDEIAGGTALLDEITRSLQYVKHLLFVTVGMDVGKVQCLSRLRNLNSMQWVIDRDANVLGEGSPEEALARAFESFEVKPKIRVDTMDYSRVYGKMSRFPYNW